MRAFVESKGGYGVTRVFSHDYVLYETTIPSHSTVYLTNNEDFVSLRIPAVPPTYSGEYLSVDQQKREQACVRWSYTLEIHLPNWGGGFSSRTPVLVSSTPPFSFQLQEYRHAQSDPDLLDPWTIYGYAVFGPKENDMAPALTRTNDKGRLRPAQCDPVPLDGATYRPRVNTYAGPSAKSQRSASMQSTATIPSMEFEE